MQTKINFFSTFSEKLYFGIEQTQHLRCICNEIRMGARWNPQCGNGSAFLWVFEKQRLLLYSSTAKK